MSIEEEVKAYLAGVYRRNQLSQLEMMAARPTLAQRRLARPRVGVLRRFLRLLIGR